MVGGRSTVHSHRNKLEDGNQLRDGESGQVASQAEELRFSDTCPDIAKSKGRNTHGGTANTEVSASLDSVCQSLNHKQLKKYFQDQTQAFECLPNAS